MAVKLIVEREHEIEKFNSTSAYKVDALFTPLRDAKVELNAELNKRFADKEEAMTFLTHCQNAKFHVSAIEKTPGKKSPAPPFTTSTLQQEAARKLGFSVSKTMVVAQQLYEAGYITYMRTDSVNLSNMALAVANKVVASKYGEDYAKTRKYVTKSKGAQEAHEAIRPTDITRETIPGDTFAKNLYELIWKRTIASQMSDAKTEKTTISIPVEGRAEKFVAAGEVILFPGFLKVYTESKDDDNEEIKGVLPNMELNEELNAKQIAATQRFAQPPVRYTEASLVKKLEELGIGRPSTYAPTISTIQKREYVRKATRQGKERQYVCLTLTNNGIQEEVKKEKFGYEKDKLIPTDVGIVVNDYLQENFKDIMDYGFTADVEKEFDDIAEGKANWQEMMHRFYGDFHQQVDTAINYSTKASGERLLGYDPKTNEKVFAKLGKYGPMVQIGESYADAKPRYARLQADQFIDTITLEEALDLFRLPRNLGEWNGQAVSVGVGRFGPYVRCGNIFESVPKGEDPYSITLERSIELLESKVKKTADRTPHLIGHLDGKEILAASGRYGPYIKYDGKNITLDKGMDVNSLTEEQAIEYIKNKETRNVLLSFSEDENIKVMNGRYGPYITNGTDNFKIPKDQVANKLTYQDCVKIIEETAPTAKKRTVRRKKA